MGETRTPHGTLNRYRRHGCRCDDCRAASTEDARRFRTANREKVNATKRRWWPNRPERDETPHGTTRGYTYYECRCEQCLAAFRPLIRRTTNRWGRSIAPDDAPNRGKEWTGPELETVMRPDLSLTEAAKILGRTVWACRRARELVRTDPRKRRLAGLTDPPPAPSPAVGGPKEDER